MYTLANLESNENQVFYWVYDVGYEGVLLRGLDGYGTVGTGFGAGTGAGTVQVRCGHGTWVRSVRYPYQPSRTYLFANRPTSKKANRALLLKLANVYKTFTTVVCP